MESQQCSSWLTLALTFGQLAVLMRPLFGRLSLGISPLSNVMDSSHLCSPQKHTPQEAPILAQMLLILEKTLKTKFTRHEQELNSRLSLCWSTFSCEVRELWAPALFSTR